MRFGIAVACAFMASQAGAVTVVHNGDNPWAYITPQPDGTDFAYYEAEYDYFVEGLNTVRLDVQGGTIKGGGLALSWGDGIGIKTGATAQYAYTSGIDTCFAGDFSYSGCSGYVDGSGHGNPLAFLTDFSLGDTFIQFSVDVPKSYSSCDKPGSGVCSESWWFSEIFNASLVGAGPKSFTVTYSGDKVITPGPAVPEPASWAMMITGFGLAGAAMRRSRSLGLA